MSQQVLQGPKSYVASVDLLQYRVVKYVAGQNANYAGAGDDVLGVTQAGCLANQRVAVAARDGEGTFKVTVAGAVADGDKLYPTGVVGKLSNVGSGPAAYVALEAATADGDIIEARAAAVASVDSNTLGNSVSGAADGAVPIVYQLLAVAAVGGTYAIATPKRKVRIIDWWVKALDATASNVKIQNGVTDASLNIAKGVTANALVRGGDIIPAQAQVAAGTVINVVTSGASSIDIHVLCVPTP